MYETSNVYFDIILYLSEKQYNRSSVSEYIRFNTLIFIYYVLNA